MKNPKRPKPLINPKQLHSKIQFLNRRIQQCESFIINCSKSIEELQISLTDKHNEDDLFKIENNINLLNSKIKNGTVLVNNTIASLQKYRKLERTILENVYNGDINKFLEDTQT